MGCSGANVIEYLDASLWRDVRTSRILANPSKKKYGSVRFGSDPVPVIFEVRFCFGSTTIRGSGLGSLWPQVSVFGILGSVFIGKLVRAVRSGFFGAVCQHWASVCYMFVCLTTGIASKRNLQQMNVYVNS